MLRSSKLDWSLRVGVGAPSDVDIVEESPPSAQSRTCDRNGADLSARDADIFQLVSSKPTCPTTTGPLRPGTQRRRLYRQRWVRKATHDWSSGSLSSWKVNRSLAKLEISQRLHRQTCVSLRKKKKSTASRIQRKKSARGEQVPKPLPLCLFNI